jgi:hypothetical protein
MMMKNLVLSFLVGYDSVALMHTMGQNTAARKTLGLGWSGAGEKLNRGVC